MSDGYDEWLDARRAAEQAEFDDWTKDVDDAEQYLELLREMYDEERAWARYERFLDGEWPDDYVLGPVTSVPRP